MPSTGTRSPSARKPTSRPAWVSALPEAQTTGIEADAGGLIHDLFGGKHVAEPADAIAIVCIGGVNVLRQTTAC